MNQRRSRVAVAVIDKRGLKRICMACSTRFYDFNKRPVTCPSCSAEFTGDIKVRARRARPLLDDDIAPKILADEPEIEVIKDDEAEEEVADAETISLDEAEELEVVEEEDEVEADLELDEDEDDDDDDEDDDLEDEEEDDK
jgi:uncharacterized protein (TIGR02300 family)